MVETQLVIIQPTPLCNIDCRYCYLPARMLKKRIEMHTLARISEAFFTSPFAGESITFVWHAGEPLVLPVRFYEQAFRCVQEQNSRGARLEHYFQTNATLITQEWCDFIKQQNVQIGVSLDGPRHIHDANRVDRKGSGTFERVMRGVCLLQQNEIPFSVIAVVTQHSLPYAEEIWRFFAGVRPERLCLNPEEQEGVHQHSTLQGEEHESQYRAFLEKLLMCNSQADELLHIREFETIRTHVRSGKPLTRSQTNVPGVIFSFDCDGNVSTFSPEMLTVTHAKYGTFHFGSVFTDTLEQILASQKCQQVHEEIQLGVHRCLQTCEYFLFCGGGFPSNKLSEHGTFDAAETQACRLRIKATADVLLEHWEAKYQLSTSAVS